MAPKLLVLGGTTEASALARLLAAEGIAATLSYAGRTRAPVEQPLPTRAGGFGGVEGLTTHIRQEAITHLVDATHPFAAQMSRNATEAAARAGIAHARLTRPPWHPGPGDRWTEVADMAAAVKSLAGPPRRVFLALGRLNLAAFATRPQHHYLLRLVDPPETPLPLPDHHVVIDRGPFREADDRALLTEHRIDLVLAKNAGGEGARAKLDAARALGLPVTLIARPSLPDATVFHRPEDLLAWLAPA